MMNPLKAGTDSSLFDRLADSWHLAGPMTDMARESQTGDYSPKLSLWLALCASAAYAEPEEADRIFGAAGFDPVISVKAGGTEAYLARHQNGGRPLSVLSFRGTDGGQDLLMDAKVLPVTVPWRPTCRAHRGFLMALEAVWCDLVYHLGPSQPEVLYITGHSLGGALAMLAAHRLTQQEGCPPPTAVYTIGCPRIGNRALVQSISESVQAYRVVWAGDTVSRMPPWYFGYRHVGEEWWLRPGVTDARAEYFGKTFVEWLLPPERDLRLGSGTPVSERLRWLQLAFTEFHMAQVALSAASVLALMLAWWIMGGAEAAASTIFGVAAILFVLVQLGVWLLPNWGPRSVVARLRYQRLRDHDKLGYVRELASRAVLLPDLISGGKLESGMKLFPRHKKFSDRVATLLPDGQVEVDGVAFAGPSQAASAIVGKRTNGWSFFLTNQASRRSLSAIRRDYVDGSLLG